MFRENLCAYLVFMYKERIQKWNKKKYTEKNKSFAGIS